MSASKRAAPYLEVLCCCIIPGLAVTATASEARRDVPPAPRDVILKSLTAMGGVNALAALRTIEASGTYEGPLQFPGRFRWWQTAANQRRISWDIRYIEQDHAFDGTTGLGWERNKSTRELTGRELARQRRAAMWIPLLQYHLARTPIVLQPASASADEYVVCAELPEERKDCFAFDRKSFLLRAERRIEEYEEGPRPVVVEYSDYRQVGGVRLPHLIRELRPDQSAALRVERYRINRRVPAAIFANPSARHSGEPYEITLKSSPSRLYKVAGDPVSGGWVRFVGIPFPDSESWTADLVIDEKYGRYLQPVAASARLFSKGMLIKTEQFSRRYLAELQSFPVSRFFPQPEIYHFRHLFSAAASLEIDQLVYSIEVATPAGTTLQQSVDVEVAYYQPKSALICPIKGRFLVVKGHEPGEREHKFDRSMHFALDIVPLGENYELIRNGEMTLENFVGFGGIPIIAPADGVVVHARGDMPPGPTPPAFANWPTGLGAIAGGNTVVIDHGHGEYSILAHLDAVSVRAGEHVKQGDALGTHGASGTHRLPHLHYALQSGPNWFDADGLPVHFTNVERLSDGVEAQPGAAQAAAPASLKRGIYYIAR